MKETFKAFKGVMPATVGKPDLGNHSFNIQVVGSEKEIKQAEKACPLCPAKGQCSGFQSNGTAVLTLPHPFDIKKNKNAALCSPNMSLRTLSCSLYGGDRHGSFSASRLWTLAGPYDYASLAKQGLLGTRQELVQEYLRETVALFKEQLTLLELERLTRTRR